LQNKEIAVRCRELHMEYTPIAKALDDYIIVKDKIAESFPKWLRVNGPNTIALAVRELNDKGRGKAAKTHEHNPNQNSTRAHPYNNGGKTGKGGKHGNGKGGKHGKYGNRKKGGGKQGKHGKGKNGGNNWSNDNWNSGDWGSGDWGSNDWDHAGNNQGNNKGGSKKGKGGATE
jgi:hypothetical protein